MRAGLMLLFAATTALAQQPAKWRLVEEWRVGGEVDGPHSFGDVRGMGILPDGRIVLVDYKDQQVHFLDTKGQPVRTAGRKGAGPGEYQQANGLAVSPKGEVLVNDASLIRFTLLSSNGDLIKTIPIPDRWGYGYTWDAFYNANGLLNEFVALRNAADRTSTSARRTWSADFSKSDTMRPAVCPNAPRPNPSDFIYSFGNERSMMSMSIPYVSPRIAIVHTPDGAMWYGRFPGYGTIVRTPAGKCEPDITIQLRGPRLAVATATRDSSIEQVKAGAARFAAPVPDLNKIPREYPAFDAIILDGSQRLWVERMVDVKTRHYEVFSPVGVQVADVSSPVAFVGYRPLIITNDRILGFIKDQDDIVYLVALRVVR